MSTHRTTPPPDVPVSASPEDGWAVPDFQQVTDEELASLARPNVLESAAYFELWRRYHGYVSALVHQRMQGQDAEHTVTAFFCHKLPAVLDRFTPRPNSRRSFEAWLKRVVTNYLNDEWRRGRTRRKREVRWGHDLSDVAERSQALARSPRVERKADTDHLAYFLRHIMEEVLEPVDQYIYRARYWEDLSMKEIAQALDLTEANVRIRHWRAKQRLQKVCSIYREAGLL